MKNSNIRVDIWHNLLWPKYKGAVFTALYRLVDPKEMDLRFFQLAETEGSRSGLSSVDLTYHQYPYTLLFHGSIDAISPPRKILAVLRQTIRSNADIHILFGYETAACWLQLLVVILKGKKAAVFCDSTIFDHPQSKVKGLLKTVFFKLAKGVFCYGSRTKEYVVAYGANPKTAFYPCQAAALPVGYDSARELANRLFLAPKQETLRYLFVGRFIPEKNLECLLAAFSNVLKKKPHAKLVMVGMGPEQLFLQNRARELGISSSVVWAGSKSGSELFQEYARATALVLCSTSEPWGLVVNEALSYGCPVIVSERCGCVPELVVDGKTGFVCKANDVQDLADKMLAVPEHFSDIERTALACQQLMDRYTPDTAAKTILEGIRTIVALR